jgi:ribonuclease H
MDEKRSDFHRDIKFSLNIQTPNFSHVVQSRWIFSVMPSTRTTAELETAPPSDTLIHQEQPKGVDDDDAATVAALYQTPAVPCLDRHGTIARTRLLLSRHSSPHMPHGEGPTVLSEMPITCDNLMIGIDEAGRGSLIGPMIYGMVYWSASDTATIPTTDFGDSKQINEKKRNALFEEILRNDRIGFGIRVLSAAEISRNMLRTPHPYNLNQMSHDAAIALIRSVYTRVSASNNCSIQACYIDTVGNPQVYKKRLEQEFPGVQFVVESKADDKYAPCSAASIGTSLRSADAGFLKQKCCTLRQLRK